MKQESGKKSKLWLWLLLALVAVAAIAAAVIAVLLPGQGNQEETPGEQTVQSEIYWNIDGAHYVEISEVAGTSAREIGEDGYYHIEFLVNGERKEYLVADKRLVNYMDSMQLMGLVFDENGYVIDALDIKTVAEEVAREFFVRKLENGILEINSSRAMNGMPLQVTVDDNTIISDMTAAGDALDQPGTPEPLDKIHVYKTLDGTKTFVYIVERAPEQKAAYWRVERCWDATAGKTTRVPDKNGVYTMEFACNGEVVELKCRNAALVGTIDSSAVLTGQFCFEFDEEGYIVGTVDVGSATRTTYAASDFHVTGIEGDTITVTRLSSGSNQGKVVTFKMAEEYDIFHCCQYACYDGDCGQRLESLQLGDRVNVYTDLDGNGKLIFVTRRLCGSPMYYNFDRQYGGNLEVGTLRKKTGGYYVFEMLCEGKIVKVKVKDKKLADQMESIYNRCMGLKLDKNNVVERLYDATCVYGGANLGTESFVTELTGPVITIASSASDTTWNSILSGDCKVYNVIQGEYGAKVGGETDLRIGDQITAFRNIQDQMQIIFVMSRPVDGGKVYYNLQRKYNTAEKTTTREPNEEGYYEFLLASEGKQVTAKTKSKGMASFIDEQLAPLVGLKVNKNGIITNAYSVTAVLKQSAKSCNYRYVEKVTKKTFNTFYYPAATPDKKTVDTTTWNIAKDCKVYNVSTAVSEFRGEKSTLKNGDYIQAIRNLKTNEITQIWIMTRNPAYGVKNYKAHCDHCDETVTWEPYVGKVTSGVKHYFLFDNMFYAQAVVGTSAADDATYDVVLDLNGKTLNGDGRCFLVYDHLTIMDTKGGGKLMGTNPASSGSAHSGGCIMVAGGKLDILGGTLGQSEKSTEFGTLAGVIYVGGAGVEVNMYGGTLLGGTTTQNGGCVGIYGGTFNLYDGEIKGGTSPLGANVYISTGTLNLQGGTVDGGIEMGTNGKVTLTGKVTVTGTGIKVPSGKKLDLSKLAAEARITVNAAGIFTEAYDNIADYQTIFTPALEEDKIIVKENALCYISSGPSDFVLDTDNDGMAVCPVCNVDVTWTPVTGRLGAGMSGHYYLNADINDSNSQWATTTAKDAVLCVHMNGYNLTTSGRIAVVGNGGTINIMGDGTITGEGDYAGTDADAYTKATLVVASTGSINLYGNVKVTTTAEGKPVVSVRTGFTLNDNATIECSDTSTGIIMERGTVTLNGGKITGGVLAEAGTLTLDGAVEADLMGITAAAKLKVMESFTGTANALFANPLVDGVVPEANGISTGAFTGKLYSLDLETAEPTQLFGKSGRLCTEAANVTPPTPDFVLDPDGDNKAVCPVCGGAEVTWTPLEAGQRPGTATSGHFYLLADSVNTDAQYATTTAKTHTICLHLNGKNLTTAGRIAIVGNGGTINIMGEGNITSNASSAYSEATLVAGSSGTMNLFDDVTVTIAADGKPVVDLRSSTTLTLNGNAKIVAKTGGVGIAVSGKLFLNDAAAVDNMTVAASGKVTVNGNWTGSAKVTFAAALVEGVVPEANGASTGSFTGSLTMGTDKLIGKDGKLMVETVDPQVAKGNAVATAAAAMDFTGYQTGTAVRCPVCEKDVTWEPINGMSKAVVDGGHYYVAQDITGDGIFLTVSGKVVCVHLNGKTLTYGARIFATSGSAATPGTLNMMGSGTVSSSNAHETYGTGTIHAASSGIINLYGGTYKSTGANTKAVVHTTGGKVNIYSGATIDSNTGTNVLLEKGTVTLYGGTIKNGTGFLSGSNRLGGNVYLKSSGSVFNMVDGTITGGTATYGGNVRGEAGTTITMDAGSITGGNATGGAGNVNTNGTFTMNGGTVSGGTTTAQGGNIWSKAGTVTIGKDAIVFGGSAKEGGNICIIGESATKIGTLNISGTVYGGTTSGTAAHGGNISGGSNTVINITGGQIYGGTAAGQGGNIRTYNGQLNISGGEIYGGTAQAASNHNVWVAGDTGVLTFTGGTVKGLDGTSSSGTAINIGTGSTLNLGGTATALRADGISKGLVYIYNGKLNVLNDWTGSASVKFATAYTAGTTISNTVAQCGAMVESVFTAGGSYAGTLMNEMGDAVKILGVDGALVLDQLPTAE